MALPPHRPPPRSGALAPKPPEEDAIAKSRREKDQLEGECQKLEEELEALRARYEQYFLGTERKEPVRLREELRKRVLRLKEAFTRNTGLKFRIQSLNARYLTYERLWLRSGREKEEGTYRRDLFKARLRAPREEPASPPAEKEGPARPVEATGATLAEAAAAAAAAARPAAPASQKARPAAAKPPPSPAAGAVSEEQLRALYTAYVAAKKSCNEDVSRLTYEAVARSVSKQVPDLMTRYKAKAVEFRVEVKDGRAVLKAIPKV